MFVDLSVSKADFSVALGRRKRRPLVKFGAPKLQTILSINFRVDANITAALKFRYEGLSPSDEPGVVHPLAVRAVKRLAYQGMNMTLEAGLEAERFTSGAPRDTKDRIEGRRAFQERRKPVFRGE